MNQTDNTFTYNSNNENFTYFIDINSGANTAQWIPVPEYNKCLSAEQIIEGYSSKTT